MNYPAFQHGTRETFDHQSKGWVSGAQGETAADTTDRLVLHGIRCGKRSLQALSVHAGFASSDRCAQAARSLERLEARGLVRRDGKGWVLA